MSYDSLYPDIVAVLTDVEQLHISFSFYRTIKNMRPPLYVSNFHEELFASKWQSVPLICADLDYFKN